MYYLNNPIDPEELAKIDQRKNIIFYSTTDSGIITHENISQPCLKLTMDYVNLDPSHSTIDMYELKVKNLKLSIPTFVDFIITDVCDTVFTKVIHNYSVKEAYVDYKQKPEFYICDEFSFILHTNANRIRQKRDTFTIKNEKYVKFIFFIRPTYLQDNNFVEKIYAIQDTCVFEQMIEEVI